MLHILFHDLLLYREAVLRIMSPSTWPWSDPSGRDEGTHHVPSMVRMPGASWGLSAPYLEHRRQCRTRLAGSGMEGGDLTPAGI